MRTETAVGELINKMYDADIYENKRTKNLVELRSLMCYILHKDLNLTLYTIRDHFNSKGKSANHTTIYYNIRLFEEFRKSNKTFEESRDKILNELNPKILLLEKIKEMSDNKIEAISNCVNYYE